jgi:IS5 family transposase
LEVETPDHASIWRFRQTIEKLGLSAALLMETNRQPDALGLVVKRGTLADATLIAASVKRPAYGDNGLNPRDPDARITMKRKKPISAARRHLAVDEGRGLVRQAEMTSANVHDSCLAEALIQGDEQGYSADKAYGSQAFREALERRGLIDGVAKARAAPSSARRLAEAFQRLVVEHPLRRRARSRHDRARSRHDEAMVRHEPRPLSRARPQRLSSPVCRHRHEHEAGACAHGAKLRNLFPADPRRALREAIEQAPAATTRPNPRLQPSPQPRKSVQNPQKPQL